MFGFRKYEESMSEKKITRKRKIREKKKEK